jgi:endogenous inhibitor of DNA gyrase (YacG/DUF329 family)
MPIPENVPCPNCEHPITLRGDLGIRAGCGSKSYQFDFAGGECPRCGRAVQYGRNGDSSDYRWGRWYYIGKTAEQFLTGPARRWPSEWDED